MRRFLGLVLCTFGFHDYVRRDMFPNGKLDLTVLECTRCHDKFGWR